MSASVGELRRLLAEAQEEAVRNARQLRRYPKSAFVNTTSEHDLRDAAVNALPALLDVVEAADALVRDIERTGQKPKGPFLAILKRRLAHLKDSTNG